MQWGSPLEVHRLELGSALQQQINDLASPCHRTPYHRTPCAAKCLVATVVVGAARRRSQVEWRVEFVVGAPHRATSFRANHGRKQHTHHLDVAGRAGEVQRAPPLVGLRVGDGAREQQVSNQVHRPVSARHVQGGPPARVRVVHHQINCFRRHVFLAVHVPAAPVFKPLDHALTLFRMRSPSAASRSGEPRRRKLPHHPHPLLHFRLAPL
mmetsp:Transcript_81711/g.163134  ORF Transcript_81711/g.163134 Transcript_81711/m.163134 type:complete len:210 (-) Transcript_81711:1010-1639(-)